MISVCIVTGSRAEYGLLKGLMEEIVSDPDLTLATVVTGAHLSSAYGDTYRWIEQDGFVIDERIPLDLSGNTPLDVARSVSQGISGFASAFDRVRPDLVVVLGDRYEVLAAAQAAMLLNLPIAHIHGGEITEGSIDNAMRHSITKMAHLHFTATETYRRRVIQMGEDPRTVFNVGSPGVDQIRKHKPIEREELERRLSFPLRERSFLVALHPDTLNPDVNEFLVLESIAALDHFPEASVLITLPNADAGSRTIRTHLERYADSRPERVKAVPSLDELYLSALYHSTAVIGNSSSGIIEAPALGTPTVNIGDRQKGRLRAASVLDAGIDSSEIVHAIRTAISDGFQENLRAVNHPYGSGNAALEMKKIIKRGDFRKKLAKTFYDVEIGL